MLARQDYDIKLLKKINASMAKLDNAIKSSEERDYYIKYSYGGNHYERRKRRKASVSF